MRHAEKCPVCDGLGYIIIIAFITGVLVGLFTPGLLGTLFAY